MRVRGAGGPSCELKRESSNGWEATSLLSLNDSFRYGWPVEMADLMSGGP